MFDIDYMGKHIFMLVIDYMIQAIGNEFLSMFPEPWESGKFLPRHYIHR